MTYTLRPATAADQSAISTLVRESGINPMGLDWPRFLVAEDAGRIVGVGQVKPHGDGSRELASIATAPDRRGQGIAGAIIRELVAHEKGTIYLMCAHPLEPFYVPFGFRAIAPPDMPPYFRRMRRLSQFLLPLFTRLAHRPPHHLVIMRRGRDTE